MQLAQAFNLGIAISYFSIPFSLSSSAVQNWRVMPLLLRLTLIAFALFIAACGTGHGLMAWTGHSTPTLTVAHGITLLISAPVALAFPTIADRLSASLLQSQHLTKELSEALLQSQQLTKELSQSEAMFHVFLDTHPNLMAWIKDETLVNTYSNQALIRRFGTTPIGKRDVDWLPAETAAAVNENDRRVLATGQPDEIIELVPTPDGVMRTWQSYKFLLQVDGQRFVGGTASDITEQEKLRRDVELAFRELEEFTYAASHDLKTPLRGIKGLLSILDRRLKTLADQDRTILNQVCRDCDYAIALVDGILAYNKVGQAQTHRAPVDVVDLLAQVCGRFSERFLELGATISYPPELPLVSADQTQLQQVLENLIDNALKYRSDAPPIITIQLQHRSGEWVFAVSDNGLGIDTEDQERLFVMFSRLHSRSEIEGTGIGLATVRKIAQRHGGSAWIESAGLGCGSTVYFSLR